MPPTPPETPQATSELTAEEKEFLEFAQDIICARDKTDSLTNPQLIALTGEKDDVAMRVDLSYKVLFPNQPRPKNVPRIIVTPPSDGNTPAAVRNFANTVRGTTAGAAAATSNVATVSISISAVLAVVPSLLLV